MVENNMSKEDVILSSDVHGPEQRNKIFKSYKELSDWISWCNPIALRFQYIPGLGISTDYVLG